MKPAEIVLLHSPLVGPHSIEPTRAELERRGFPAITPAAVRDQGSLKWRDWPADLLRRLPKLESPVFIGHSMASLLAARLAADHPRSGMICLDGDIPRATGPTPPIAESFHPVIDQLPRKDVILPPWHKWWPIDPFEGWPASDAQKAQITSDIPQLRHDWLSDNFEMPAWDHAAKGLIRLCAWFDAEANRAEQMGWPTVRVDGIHLYPAVEPVETADAIIACLERMEFPQKMKALRVQNLSDNLSGVELADLPEPARAPGEVLVRVRAASLNYPDLLMTQGKYQFKPEVPFTSGLELAGEVIEADAASGFAPGDRVMGGNKTGAFAEIASIPARGLSRVPEGVSFACAAAMGAAYSTAYTGLVELSGLKPDQWVLVHGASGGVGLAAVDLVKAMGAKVIAATGIEAKRERIAQLYNPDAVIVSEGRFRDDISEITDGALCDIVFDPVGGDVFDESTRCVTFAGKLVVVGFTSGRIAEIATNIPLIKGFSVVGLRAGEYARRFPERGAAINAEIAEMAAAGRINPAIDRVLPLSQWREGFEAMAGRELVGKVVFELST
ncbi:MAG: NADPH:quinone oxidoreductase family protein [Pseudomonadota bacterium]